MIITKEFTKCLKKACIECKKIVSQNGPDAKPGLLNEWTTADYYKKIEDNVEEFTKEILEHPFFAGKKYQTVVEVAEKEPTLFLYCLQCFLNDKFIGSLVTNVDMGSIEVNPESTEVINKTNEVSETENRKEFIKEVLDGIPQKKTLREFLEDPRSYKQFRDQVDECMFFIDWEKIHRIMKTLKWKWVRWEDGTGNEHENTTPSVYGIKKHVYEMIKGMENFILEHGDMDHYLSGTGGFEYEMWVCEPATPDDFDSRVRLVVRFVPEHFDTGM